METTLQPLVTHGAMSQTLSKEQVAFSKEFTALPVKRIDELLVSTAPAIHMVDRESLAICVSALIGKYLNFIRCSDCMDKETTYETACMMIDAHPHLPVDAIKTFFYECKRGSFGFHYNKMDGTKLLMWYDKFVNDYYVQLEDMEYNKHFSTKGDLASVPNLKDEDGEPIDFEELYASFHGRSKEQIAREKLIADIRKNVQNKHMHLFNEMSVEEADRIIEDAIIEELKAKGILTF